MIEKRIYAVVAETVDTPARRTVVQIPGRMAAQAGHALSRMRMHRQLDLFRHHLLKVERKPLYSNKAIEKIIEPLLIAADEAITTIHLACRDSRELLHVSNLLHKAYIKHYAFQDNNPAVYGAGEIVTAIATVPVSKAQVVGILDYLPLFLAPK